MTRLNLADIPAHLLGKPASNPDEHRLEQVARLRRLRGELSRCAGRMSPSEASIMREAGRIEQALAGLRALAVELGEEQEEATE